ncbi:glycosyltransferase [Vibrio europaeus]|uniref:glycosyltransferase family 2 protein n=1 Tax=Vibrio europaeus TaxID=300876 RepID=UPI00234275CD|nr:glycosyltransferase family 2 protein [Vibrio europaeus]MDC5850450.1 glycosyltransferase [Vibrio europaeus]
MKPLITVGMTCYNAAGSIEAAIKSAINQDWSNLEIVIVDDCSTDNSWQLLQKLSNDYHQVKVFKRDVNGGPAAARNTILENSSGEYICFFDDDDVSLPNRVSTQYLRLSSYEKHVDAPVACYASGARRYDNDYELQIDAIGSKLQIPVAEDVADYLLFNNRNPSAFYGGGTPTCALMARKSVIEQVGRFDENLRRVEDVDLAIRLAMAGGHFIGCPEKLYIQKATTGSDKTPEKNLESELKLLDKHSDYLNSKGRLEYSKSWFKIRYYHFSDQRFKFLLSLSLFLVRFPIWGGRHLLLSAPNRLKHEKKMKQ